MSDDRSDITIIVNHNGKTYRRGPWRVHVTTSKHRAVQELRYLVFRFMGEIEREIKLSETRTPDDSGHKVQATEA